MQAPATCLEPASNRAAAFGLAEFGTPTCQRQDRRPQENRSQGRTLRGAGRTLAQHAEEIIQDSPPLEYFA
jgi:hypothetical protein